MIDWSKASVDDFEIQVEGHEVQEAGTNINFPVRVYHKNGEFAFVLGVPIRTEFYHSLKKTEQWQGALMKILRQRIRDELQQRIKPETVSIQDKVDFISLDRQPI